MVADRTINTSKQEKHNGRRKYVGQYLSFHSSKAKQNLIENEDVHC